MRRTPTWSACCETVQLPLILRVHEIVHCSQNTDPTSKPTSTRTVSRTTDDASSACLISLVAREHAQHTYTCCWPCLDLPCDTRLVSRIIELTWIRNYLWTNCISCSTVCSPGVLCIIYRPSRMARIARKRFMHAECTGFVCPLCSSPLNNNKKHSCRYLLPSGSATSCPRNPPPPPPPPHPTATTRQYAHINNHDS